MEGLILDEPLALGPLHQVERHDVVLIQQVKPGCDGRHLHAHLTPWHLDLVEEARKLLELNDVDCWQKVEDDSKAHGGGGSLSRCSLTSLNSLD